MTARGARLARVAGLLLLKVSAGAWVLHEGFSHVSDDDYARVVIAERFAHAPGLDPSGTSWLPLPFWVNGAAMMAWGRSLATAVDVAWVFGLLSVVVGYAAMRTAGVARTAAWASAALAATTPWNAWLGVATVPEALTSALIFVGAMSLSGPPGRAGVARVLGGGALLAGALSRYEAWPVCALFAALCLVEALRERGDRRRRSMVAMGLAVAGPCLWMAWNVHAHGSAVHFLSRVTAFHASHTEDLSLGARLLAYPDALVSGAPELVAIGSLGLLGGAEVRARWRGPLLAIGALFAFLVSGEVTGGAPTHHPERALVAVWWTLAGFGVDGARAFVLRYAWGRPKREAWVVAFVLAATGEIASERLERMREYPGRGREEDRAPQVARGMDLRAADVASATVVPCQYEHFAVLAAWGAPERATVTGGTGEKVTSGCPEVRVP